MRVFKMLDKNDTVNENPVVSAKIVEGGDYKYVAEGQSRAASKGGSRGGSRVGSRLTQKRE